MRLIIAFLSLIGSLIIAPARLWLCFWRAVRYWHVLNYSWHLAWIKARRAL